MKKENLQQTVQEYKGVKETTVNNYMTIKQIIWEKWRDSQKWSVFQD